MLGKYNIRKTIIIVCVQMSSTTPAKISCVHKLNQRRRQLLTHWAPVLETDSQTSETATGVGKGPPSFTQNHWFEPTAPLPAPGSQPDR